VPLARGNVTRGNVTRGNVTRGNGTRGNVARAFQASAEPEILIDPREGLALRRLLVDVRTGRIDPESLPAETPALAEIYVQPIAIAPLTASSIIEGVHQ
jgi:hypothetical protein